MLHTEHIKMGGGMSKLFRHKTKAAPTTATEPDARLAFVTEHQLDDKEFWQKVASIEVHGVDCPLPSGEELLARVVAPEMCFEEAMAGGICRHATLSLRGFYPDKPADKPNQDAFSVVGGALHNLQHAQTCIQSSTLDLRTPRLPPCMAKASLRTLASATHPSRASKSPHVQAS